MLGPKSLWAHHKPKMNYAFFRHPKGCMVRRAISPANRSPLVFISTKLNARRYVENILIKGCKVPLSNQIIPGHSITERLQQSFYAMPYRHTPWPPRSADLSILNIIGTINFNLL